MAEERTLLFDVETTPNLSYTWGGKREVNVIEFLKEGYMISFAWRWLNESKVNCLSLPMFGSYKKAPENNKLLMLELKKLYEKADRVIGHNLVAFDDKVANTNWIDNDILPPKLHYTTDTLKLARKYFKFGSNSLKDLAIRLKLPHKAETGGFKLWLGCMHGVAADWRTMESYNKQDIVVLDGVHTKFLPYTTREKLKRIR